MMTLVSGGVTASRRSAENWGCVREGGATGETWVPPVLLRIYPARYGRFSDALDGQAVGSEAHRDTSALHQGPGLVERARDDVVQLRVDLGFLPEVLLQPLDPFEVGDDHAAGVRQDVGEDEHALLLEDLV